MKRKGGRGKTHTWPYTSNTKYLNSLVKSGLRFGFSSSGQPWEEVRVPISQLKTKKYWVTVLSDNPEKLYKTKKYLIPALTFKDLTQTCSAALNRCHLDKEKEVKNKWYAQQQWPLSFKPVLSGRKFQIRSYRNDAILFYFLRLFEREIL